MKPGVVSYDDLRREFVWQVWLRRRSACFVDVFSRLCAIPTGFSLGLINRLLLFLAVFVTIVVDVIVAGSGLVVSL